MYHFSAEAFDKQNRYDKLTLYLILCIQHLLSHELRCNLSRARVA